VLQPPEGVSLDLYVFLHDRYIMGPQRFQGARMNGRIHTKMHGCLCQPRRTQCRRRVVRLASTTPCTSPFPARTVMFPRSWHSPGVSRRYASVEGIVCLLRCRYRVLEYTPPVARWPICHTRDGDVFVTKCSLTSLRRGCSPEDFVKDWWSFLSRVLGCPLWLSRPGCCMGKLVCTLTASSQ